MRETPCAGGGVLGSGREELGGVQLGQFAALETTDVTVAGGEQQRNPFRSESASDEQQGGGGYLVQPMCIIDDAQHRGLLCRLRQQAQGGQEDQEPITRPGVGLPERRAQRSRLPRREVIDMPHHRAEQSLQRGERQRRLRLRLDAPGPQHLNARLDLRSGALNQVGQQRRLPDTRLPADHQRTAPRAAGLVQQPDEAFLFPFPAV
jgi:hypothetical protein